MTSYNSPKCTCAHVQEFHNISGNGSRGACSVSTGAQAVPCGCRSFKPAEPDGGLFPAPDQTKTPEGGPLL